MKYLIQVFVYVFVSTLFAVQNQSNLVQPIFENNLIAISVSNIEKSTNWYTEKLGFNIEKGIQNYPDYDLKLAFLSQGKFRIELMEMKDAISSNEVLSRNEAYVGGVFKLGFITSNIESLYNQLNQMADVDFVTEIGEVPKNNLPINWPTKYFLIKDLDGNLIQFFDSGTTLNIVPWLTMIVVDNLENSISWYVDSLGFNHYDTVGDEGNRRAILARNNQVLELYEPKHIKKAADIPQKINVLGFKKIAFYVENISEFSSNFESNDVEVISTIKKSDFDWASKYMIVKDLDGNWIQIFEIKNQY